MPVLATFQKLLSLSERMVELAKEQEWEALAELEQERSLLAAKLPASLEVLPKAKAGTVAETIERILECNKIIHGQVAPWMDHAGTLLAALAKKA